MADEPHDDSLDAHRGVGVDDLPGVMQELFLQSVADARALENPSEDFDAFIDELWRQVAAAFGLVRRDWPEGAPQPWPVMLDEQRGIAEAVLEGRVGPGELPT